MCSRKSSAKLIEVLGFTSPVFHEGKKSYVDFYAPDPETGKSKRKKYYITAPTKRQRKQLADVLITRLSVKLTQGWSPWIENRSDRGAKRFEEVLDQYLINLEKNHRLKSIQTYNSKANILKEYIKEQRLPVFYVCQFDRLFIADFLDWLLSTRNITARTRNNYLGWLNSLSEYMIERGYLISNPCAQIRNMKEPPKRRKALTPVMLRQLFSYLREHDRPFLLAVMMEYYTFVRPNEMRHIRLHDISVKSGTLYIPADVSKNKRDGKVSLNDDILRLMVELGSLSFPSDNYLFSKNFLPGRALCSADMFNRRFSEIRKQLGWGPEIKFYSLKDSGIRDLSEASGVVTARDQARHTDISTTNAYLGSDSLHAPEGARHFRGYLSPSDDPLSR